MILLRMDFAIIPAGTAKAQKRRYARFNAQPRNRQRFTVAQHLHQLNAIPFVYGILAEGAAVFQAFLPKSTKYPRLQKAQHHRSKQHPQHAHAETASVGTGVSASTSSISVSAGFVCPYRPRTITRCASTGTASRFTSSGVA